MTTPDPTPTGQPSPAPNPQSGAWAAVGKLLALQLLTVIAVTAVITGIYALAGGHDRRATAGSSLPGATASAAPSKSAPASHRPTSKPGPTPSSTSPTPSAPTTTRTTPGTHSLKVDVLNQSAQRGSGATLAARVRALGWAIGRVGSFNGNVSTTTVYYPRGDAKAAQELAGGLPGNLRVLPRFSTLSGSRLTIILTR